jgi:hemolysin activation/secretion protein
MGMKRLGERLRWVACERIWASPSSCIGLLLLAAMLLPVSTAFAQSRIFGPPGREDFELPDFEETDREEALRQRVLPRIEVPREQTAEAMRSGRAFMIEQIELRGANRLTAEDVESLTRPYLGRVVYYSEMETLRSRITDVYRKRGFVAAGAFIPDQTIRDGAFVIEVVEGRLTSLSIEAAGRLPDDAYRRWLDHRIEDVPNVFTIEETLQILQSEPQVERVEAALVPSGPAGDARLQITLLEAVPYELSAGYSNHSNPSIGEHGADLGLVHRNLFGRTDTLSMDGRVTEGLLLLETGYRLPVHWSGTAIGFDIRVSRAEIIDDAFEDLDITSTSQTYGLILEQPVLRTLGTYANLFVSAEIRRSETELRDEAIALGNEAKPKMTILRGGGQIRFRSRDRVLAARGVVSWGIDALDATDPGGPGADGRFVSGLVQVQGAQRLPFGVQAILRADGQFSSSRLLPLERFALGGISTVRGYRENELLRDNGVLVTGELRAPLYRRGDGRFDLTGLVFSDVGRGWDRGSRSRGETLWSAGLGLQATIGRVLELEGIWGRTIEVRSNSLESSLQDDGFHLRATMRFP